MNLSAWQPAKTLVSAMLDLPDNQVACQECLATLPSYIEAELGGIADRVEYRFVKRHILMCAQCGETYLDLLHLAIFEQSGQLLNPDRFPRPDLSFLSGVRRDD